MGHTVNGGRWRVELAGCSVWNSDEYRETLRLFGIDNDRCFAAPWIVGLLHHLDTCARNVLDMDTAADEQIDVDSVVTFNVSPCRQHKQGARDVAYAAWADVPGSSLAIDQRIGVTEVTAFQIGCPKQRVIHC